MKKSTRNGKPPIINNVVAQRLVGNALLDRRALLEEMFDERRDLNAECGYPATVTLAEYKQLYKRLGIAQRVVKCLPQESWALRPSVYETEDADTETPFEKKMTELVKKKNIWHYLQRADELSGIGRFGILLIGVADGQKMDQPVEGIDEEGKATGIPQERELLYLRPFDEEPVQIVEREMDEQSPRFGKPTKYTIKFEIEGQTTGATLSQTKTVHWHRVIHLADNRHTSEVFGTERMESVVNHLLDLRKLLGSSAEMFYKGAFPGFSFEVNPDIVDPEMDIAEMREEFDRYENGLQRFLAVQGVSAKSLAVQVADPRGHVESQLLMIAISLGIPKRILFGSEEAKLASSQDIRTWNKRLARRQEDYLTPMVINEVVDRFIAMGILPTPNEEDGYTVQWPDLNTTTDEERAKVVEILTKALATYISGGVDQLVPPAEFLSMFVQLEHDEVEQVLTAAEEYAAEMEKEEEEKRRQMEKEMAQRGEVPGQQPTQPGQAGSLPGEEQNPAPPNAQPK